MKTGNIPGWEKCDGADVRTQGAFLVNGQWYRPAFGRDSLQKLHDAYLEVWQTVYAYLSYEDYRGSGKRGATVSDGEEAIEKLKEWGVVDDNGDLIHG